MRIMWVFTGCNHWTREKIVLELKKLQKQNVLDRKWDKGYLFHSYTFQVHKCPDGTWASLWMKKMRTSVLPAAMFQKAETVIWDMTSKKYDCVRTVVTKMTIYNLPCRFWDISKFDLHTFFVAAGNDEYLSNRCRSLLISVKRIPPSV